MTFFDDSEKSVLEEFEKRDIPVPEYIDTVIKKSSLGDDIIMCWPSRDIVIFSEDVSDETLSYCTQKGWTVYKQYEIDFDKVERLLK